MCVWAHGRVCRDIYGGIGKENGSHCSVFILRVALGSRGLRAKVLGAQRF